MTKTLKKDLPPAFYYLLSLLFIVYCLGEIAYEFGESLGDDFPCLIN